MIQLVSYLSYVDHTIELSKEEFTIGRSPSCDRTVDASEISNCHCNLWRVKNGNDDEYFIEDRSTNGTYINGNRISKGTVVQLNDQDEVSLGERFSTRAVPKLGAFIGKTEFSYPNR